MTSENHSFRELSQMATNLIPSEIIRLGNEINKLIKEGHEIFNMTIGDFDPSEFPIPTKLRNAIINSYNLGHTNYPPAHGMLELRQSISEYILKFQNLEYSTEQILVSGGSRPLIYAAYKTIVDPGEKVIYPIPSWNNNHYCHLSEACPIEISTLPEQFFMPSVVEIQPQLKNAVMVALCSPQNPTGTMFSKDSLYSICKAILLENEQRKGTRKPIYILYDQIYSQLCYDSNIHVDPVTLFPELSDYVIFIDGMSKSFAATGVRVGWAFGPESVLNKMRAILSHIGAWAPKAEQVATAEFLKDIPEVENYLKKFKGEVHERLIGLFDGLKKLADDGFPVDVIKPQGAIYLTVKFPWKNYRKPNGDIFTSQSQITEFLLKECHWAIVPFKAFGDDGESEWYRISVGTIRKNKIGEMLEFLKLGMKKLVK
ncbi:MAG: aminotransferase class I/II-fold pyridoxal phosphate-dependent enzyme [Saprospiraceae bacterium]|nr:aminotransferase class I/II-fold pyridoxal phosphate-dependent enzyme [Saprospiraceae bacterium]MBK9632591.1 aminotransferase class I/II-fold pyridoxal phosphate-dependent enzyme [Saprospiraceae bacterium]